jgi:hypothetical protein
MDGAMEFLKFFWSRWWLRGVAAALGLLLFVRQFFGYSLFETTSAVLAALALWRDLLGWLGSLIGQLPFIPPLSADQALYLSLLLSFSVPVAMKAAEDLAKVRSAAERAALVSKIDDELRQLDNGKGLRAFFRRRALKHRRGKLQDQSGRFGTAYSLLLFLAAGASTGLLMALVAAPDLKFGGVTSAMILIAVLIAFALACRIPQYFVGAVTLVGFLATFQIAYWLDAPWVRAYVRATAEAEQTPR